MQEERETIVPNATRERINYHLRHAPLNKVTLMFTGDLDVLKRDLELLYSLDIDSKAKEILVQSNISKKILSICLKGITMVTLGKKYVTMKLS